MGLRLHVAPLSPFGGAAGRLHWGVAEPAESRPAWQGVTASPNVIQFALMGQPISSGGAHPQPWLASIGDISISPHWVSTPSGQFPIRGTTWTVTDMTREQQRMSPYGVILCLLLIWVCLVGLLFLLMKEDTITGYVQVTVQGNGFHHTTMIPAMTRKTPWEVNQLVNYARSLAAAV